MKAYDEYVHNKKFYNSLGAMFGGDTKLKIVHDTPNYKYVQYNGDNILHVANNMDDDVLNEYSEFMIGSISKVFTGVLIAILDGLNLLNYDDHIDKYINSNKQNDFSGITIDNVLRHTGGFVHLLTYKDVKFKKVTTSTDALKIFMQRDILTHKEGEKKYSSIGFVVLGAIIENVTKMKYIDAVKKYILNPCNMMNTGLGEPNITIYKKEASLLSKQENLEKYMVNAAGGMYSCVSDMIKFATNIPKLLTPDQIKKCYGYYYEDGMDTIIHNGWIYGGTSRFKVIYTKKWRVKEITIGFSTNFEAY